MWHHATYPSTFLTFLYQGKKSIHLSYSLCAHSFRWEPHLDQRTNERSCIIEMRALWLGIRKKKKKKKMEDRKSGLGVGGPRLVYRVDPNNEFRHLHTARLTVAGRRFPDIAQTVQDKRPSRTTILLSNPRFGTWKLPQVKTVLNINVMLLSSVQDAFSIRARARASS